MNANADDATHPDTDASASAPSGDEGAAAYLPKPFTPTELTAVVRHVLEQSGPGPSEK